MLLFSLILLVTSIKHINQPMTHKLYTVDTVTNTVINYGH